MFKAFTRRVMPLTLIEFIADAALCFGAVLLAALQIGLQGANAPAFMWSSDHVLGATGFALVMAMMYSFVGLYRRYAADISIWALVRRALLAVAIGAAIAFAALIVDGRVGDGAPMLGRAILYVAAGGLVIRSLAHAGRKSSFWVSRVLIVGTGPDAAGVARDIAKGAKGKAVLVGCYAAPADAASTPAGAAFFANDRLLEEVVRDQKVDKLVVAIREQRGGAVPMDALLACRIQGVRVLDLAGFYEQVHSEVPTDSLKASWLVYGHGFMQSRARAFVKRCFDLFFSALLLLLAMPVMWLAMLAIRLDSPGPIFYRQERVGRGGRIFMCRKFRSMRSDAEKDGVARWATKNDSRITTVGSFMRKTRIDELPQLFSVLCGEMSLVGPRPERPTFVEELREKIPFYDIRHSVKPGVTGWAQVRYGYCATIEDSKRKHQFDLFYVKNNSFLLDLLVLVETVSVVLFREGSQ